jgi:hypothetical protein
MVSEIFESGQNSQRTLPHLMRHGNRDGESIMIDVVSA